MADFEDATSPPPGPTSIEGQANLNDRWAGKTIAHTDPATGKPYALEAPRPPC